MTLFRFLVSPVCLHIDTLIHIHTVYVFAHYLCHRSKRCINFAWVRYQKKERRMSRVLEFKFRILMWHPRYWGVLGDGPGQPSDAVFGLDVLQFLNRIARRQIPRDIEDLPRRAYIYTMYVCIYVYIYIHTVVTVTLSSNCKFQITLVKVHIAGSVFSSYLRMESRVYPTYSRWSLWNNYEY